MTGILFLWLTFNTAPAPSSQVKKSSATAPSSTAEFASLPISLDAYFPPKAKEPVYQFRMLGMSFPLAGILVDLSESEHQNALANYEKFKAQYQEVSKLVPEWTKEFPLGPVEDLGQALKKGKQEAVMEAFEQLDNVCLACHLAKMARVQQKYHWGNFYAIKIKDPLTGAEIDWPKLMKFLDSNLSGVAIDLEEGQKENALKQHQGFKLRFQTLKDACQECHGTEERKYYVDESVQAMISGVEKALSGPSPDPQKANSLLQSIGIENCFKCHRVYIPAAIAQFPRERLKIK